MNQENIQESGLFNGGFPAIIFPVGQVVSMHNDQGINGQLSKKG